MCGISGFYGSATAGDVAVVERMGDAMGHRGPDHKGLWSDERYVVLGHRRLAIVDLTAAGQQPMVSNCGRYTLVFNGEIYNHRALKAKLIDGGLAHAGQFPGDSDTAVVLAALQIWGTEALARFNGMFSLGFWDSQEHVLLLARDRMGIKPLYVSHGEDGLLFASEMRAMLASGRVERKLAAGALAQFFRYQTIHPPATLIDGVEMLPAGSWLRADDSGITTERWWSPQACKTNRATDRSGWAEKIRNTLADAVGARMEADVPLGAFLSGGIDSSAIVGLMAEQSKSRIATFNVALRNHGALDESQHARKIARRFGTDHHEITLDEGDFTREIEEALEATDHPTGDGPNAFVVSGATKRAGITVALSGLGGDELFAGYPVFKRSVDLLDKRWLESWPKPLRRAAGMAYRMARPGPAADKLAALLASDRFQFPHSYPLMRRMMLDPMVGSLLDSQALKERPDAVAQLCDDLFESAEVRALPLLSRVSIAELAAYTEPILLRDADQMSMAHSMEVRVPFLDHRLVELALGIPDKIKYPNRPKQLLTEALGDLLPEEITRRPKQGFVLPWDSWMRGDLKPLIESGLGHLKSIEGVKAAGIDGLYSQFNGENPRIHWTHIWALVTLGHWTHRHGIKG